MIEAYPSSSNPIQVAAAVTLSVVFLGVILNQIRLRKLSENFAFFFLLLGILAVVLSFNLQRGQQLLADVLGIDYSPLALIFIGMVILILIAIQYATHLTALYRTNRRLIQALAIENSHRDMTAPISGSRELMFLIPAYNEGANIRGIILELRSRYPDAVVTVVDDGSADQTSAHAREAGAIVLRHPCNLGYGCALQTGYRFALANGMKAVLQMDGDGQHPVENVDRLLKRRTETEADIVIGNRFGDRESYKVPFARRMGIALFRFILRIRHVSIDDPTSGLQLISGSVLPYLVSDDFPTDFPDADLILFLSKRKFAIHEIGAVMRRNETGKSMHAGIWKPIFYLYKMIISIFMVELRFLMERDSIDRKA